MKGETDQIAEQENGCDNGSICENSAGGNGFMVNALDAGNLNAQAEQAAEQKNVCDNGAQCFNSQGVNFAGAEATD